MVVETIISKSRDETSESNNNNNNNMTEIYKYSRSTLYSLKNNKLSMKKPECFFRPDLHSLGLWKVASTKNERSLKSASSSSSASQQAKMRFFAPAGMKYAEEGNKSGGYNSAVKKKLEPCSSNIDPRSISSAHLLPAFAKRRLMSTSETSCTDLATTTTTPDEPSDSGEKQSKRETKEKNNASISSRNSDRRGENNVFLDEAQQSGGGGGGGIEENFEREQNMSPISPTSSSSFKNGYHNNERRIGSGRFIPRDINWDHPLDQKKYPPPSEFSKDPTSQVYKNNIKTFYCPDSKRNDNKEKRNPVNSEEILGNTRRDSTNRRCFPSKTKDIIESVHRANHKSGGVDRNRRYHHQHYNDNIEEPEWFSEGPTSKLDTIELRGFDEIDEKPYDLNLGNELNSDTLHEPFELKDNSDLSIIQQNGESNSNRSTPTPINNMKSLKNNEAVLLDNDKSNFNLDNFLSLDSLQSPLMNMETHYSGDTSRFSQWFMNSSEKDDKADQNLNMERNNDGEEKADKNENRTLIDFLKAGNITQTVSINKPLNVHSIPSVEELEARMRKINTHNENEMQNNKQSENMDVFNRFLNQLKENTLQSSKKLLSNVDNSIHKKKGFNLQQHSTEMIPIYKEPSSPQPVFPSVDLNSTHNVNTGNHINILSGHETYLENGTLLGELVKDGHPLIEKKSLDGAIPLPEEKNCQNAVEKHLFNTNSIGTTDAIKHLNNSPSYGHIPVPSPLSFTPTSVLRKMTAEKELHGQNSVANVNQVDLQNQNFYKTIMESAKVNNNSHMNFQDHPYMMQNIIPRMILGGNSNTFLPTRQKDIPNNVAASSSPHPNSNHVMDHNKWNYHAVAGANIKSPKPLDVLGRPILKGNVQNMPLIQPQHVHHQQQQQQQPYYDPKMEYSVYHAEIMRRNQLNSQMFLQPQLNQPIRIMDHPNSPLNNHNIDRQGMIARSFQPLEYVETLHNNGVNTFFDGHGPMNNIAANDINGFQKDDTNNTQLNHWFRPPVLSHSNVVCRQQPPCEKNSALTLEEFEKKIQIHPSSTVVNH